MSRKLGSQYQAHDNVIRFAVLTLPRILQHVSGNARTWRTAATAFAGLRGRYVQYVQQHTLGT